MHLDKQMILCCLKYLPAIQQNIVTMVFWDNLNYREIADKMGISKSSVAREYQEAMNNLQKNAKKIKKFGTKRV